MSSAFLDEITLALDSCGSGPIIVHSNIMCAMKAVKLTANVDELLARHISALDSCAGHRQLLFPTFNYQFPETQVYCLQSSESQVGHLSEFARKHWADWRTEVPIFSFCGKGKIPKYIDHSKNTINPFGKNTVFSGVVENDGIVLLYGTSIQPSTIIHYVEEMLDGGPLYRYEKKFLGTVKSGDVHADRLVTLLNHVRPLGKVLNYDWEKLERDLLAENILYQVRDGASIAFAFSAKKFFVYAKERMALDPYYLLDKSSKLWVSRMIDSLGRRFHIDDFE